MNHSKKIYPLSWFFLIAIGLSGCGTGSESIGPQGKQVTDQEIGQLLTQANIQSTRESQVDVLLRQVVLLSLREKIPYESLQSSLVRRISYDCPTDEKEVCVFKLTNP